MLAGIKHKALVALGCLLLAVALAACVGTPDPVVDIEATIEARIEEKQAEDAALETKVLAMAMAKVEATAKAALSPSELRQRELTKQFSGQPKSYAPPPTTTPPPMAPPSPTPTPVPPTAASLPTAPPFVSPTATVIETCIDGTFKGWSARRSSGETLIELCNGQVWIQSSYVYRYHYAFRPDVTIVPTGGRYKMFVEGMSDSIYVEQVTDFTRTCIDGRFDGFSLEKVYTLCNGQVWQQVSFKNRLRLQLRPDVLIYRSGSGYMMKVEGVTESIRVSRLK